MVSFTLHEWTIGSIDSQILVWSQDGFLGTTDSAYDMRQLTQPGKTVCYLRKGPMKNIQVIDSALNAAYDVFAAGERHAR